MQKYAIKRLSMGVASVSIGSLFYLNGPMAVSAYAAELTDFEATTTETVDTTATETTEPDKDPVPSVPSEQTPQIEIPQVQTPKRANEGTETATTTTNNNEAIDTQAAGVLPQTGKDTNTDLLLSLSVLFIGTGFIFAPKQKNKQYESSERRNPFRSFFCIDV